MTTPATRPAAAPQTTIAQRAGAEMAPWAAEALTQVQGQNVNLLLPTIPLNGSLAFGHVARISLVRVDPNKDNGEVYDVGGGKLALAKPALNKIANGGGIQYRTRRTDDGKDPDRCEYECWSVMRSESGDPLVRVYHKEIRMPDIEAEVRGRQSDKLKADREILQFRKHLAARCETGAINRAIRGQLGLKSGYSFAELQKPFVVLRVDFQPDTSDPQVKAHYLDRGDRASAALFGPGAEASRPPIEGRATQVHDDDDEGGETLELGSGDPGAAPSPVASGNGEPVEEPNYQALALQGIAHLGLDIQEQSALFNKHGSDWKAMFDDVNARANSK